MTQSNILAENLIRFHTKNLNESNLDKLSQISTDEGIVGSAIAAVGAPVRAVQNAVSNVVDPNFEASKGKKISIAKYSGSILNIVKKLFQVWSEMDFGHEDRTRLCNKQGAPQIEQMLKSKIQPIAEDVFDTIAKIRADEGLADDKEAILALHRSLDGPGINFIMGTARTIIKVSGGGLLQVHREIMDTFFAAIRAKYSEDGRVFNSMVSDIMGNLGVEYMQICDLAGTSWQSKAAPEQGTFGAPAADTSAS